MNETKSDAQVMADRDDLEMMQRPHLWTYGTWLPLKRPKPPQFPEFALLHADDAKADGPVRIYTDANIFLTPHIIPTEKMKYDQYDSLQAVVDAGWIVD